MTDIAAQEREAQLDRLEREAMDKVSMTQIACRHNRRLRAHGDWISCDTCWAAVRVNGNVVEIVADCGEK
jgi:hypothetical protein